MKKILPILLLFGFLSIAHHGHAQTRERLIAVCQYDVARDSTFFTPNDSTTYNYSGTRSVDSSWGVQQAFDTSYTWIYNKDTGYIYSRKQNQIWGTSLHPQTDTSWQWDRTSGQFVYSYYFTSSYNGSNLPDTGFTYSWNITNSSWANTGVSIKYYNSNNEQIYQANLQWDSTLSVWDSTYLSSLTYDSQGRIDTSRTSVMMSHRYGFMSILTYDSIGRISSQTDLSRNYDTGTWRNNDQILFTYDTLSNLSVVMGYGWDTTHWSNRDSTAYTYDAHHNRTGYLEYQFNNNGGWDNYKKYTATFDTFDMITSYMELNWSTSGAWIPGQGDRMYHYYYETYSLPRDTTIDSTLAVAAIRPSGDVRIYPVPATDMLSIDIHWTEHQQATVSIYDMMGRLYGTWPTTCTASWHGYIPVATLPAGTYTMIIRGTSGSTRRTFDVVR